ncbi:rhomboid family intramembrane serine protease [Methylibium rhizosphaerae]|uniref:rhomboid family intramembrane serine protease n=1 Tax=Methylibium rhizosphaerae TaxID=2570323 RepID=UPI00112EF308|nr:rhomboid family intramembrane serine protease [Methylibium rhizosphaerae]
MPQLPPVTQALLLINTGVFCLQFLFGFWMDRLFALWPLGTGFLPWQVVSYAFLHGDFGHLFFNMLGLWMFGSELEQVWGRKRFIQFYTASLLAGAVVQLLVAPLLGSQAPVVGASGALFGLLLGYALLFPNRTIMLLIPPIPMKARTFAIVFGVLALVLGVSNTMRGVAHFAHLGGMLGGWLMMRYWRGQPPFGRHR